MGIGPTDWDHGGRKKKAKGFRIHFSVLRPSPRPENIIENGKNMSREAMFAKKGGKCYIRDESARERRLSPFEPFLASGRQEWGCLAGWGASSIHCGKLAVVLFSGGSTFGEAF